MFSFLNLSGQSKPVEPIKWTFDSNQVGPDEYELLFIANFENPWVVYSMETPEDGPIPTSITYTSENVEYDTKPKESGERIEKMDKMFDLKIAKYGSSKPYMIKHLVKINDVKKPVTGYVQFMACNDKYCLPPNKVNFKFSYTVNGAQNVPPGAKINLKKAVKKF